MFDEMTIGKIRSMSWLRDVCTQLNVIVFCCRICGLSRYINVNCTSDSVFAVRLDLPWAVVVNAFVVIFFYFILAWELRRCRTKVSASLVHQFLLLIS